MKKVVGIVLVISSCLLFNMGLKAEGMICYGIESLLPGCFGTIDRSEVVRQLMKSEYMNAHHSSCQHCNNSCNGDEGCIFECHKNELLPYLSLITELNHSEKNIANSEANGIFFNWSGLNWLRSVDLSNNQLTDYYLAPSPSTPDSLRRLIVKNNKLRKFSSGYYGLEYLDLSYNQLSEFKAPSKLSTLLINNNQLTNLDLTKYTNLKTLAVEGNNISNLDVSDLTSLTNLTKDAKTFVKFAKFNSSLKVNGNHQIEGNKLGTKISTVKSLITVNNNRYKTTYTNKGQTVSDNSNVTTGTILITSLGDVSSEYKFVVVGDITGTGDVNVADVARLYQYYKKKVDMESEFILAGDVAKDGKIEINDISKLYQYSKNKIDSLE